MYLITVEKVKWHMRSTKYLKIKKINYDIQVIKEIGIGFYS